jgi:hypothetical protein
MTHLRVQQILIVGMAVLYFLPFPTAAAQSDGTDAQTVGRLIRVLSGRDGVPSTDVLVEIAGDEDSLVKSLLELRQSAPYPFVSIRAESRLLEFSERSDVQAALQEDASDSRTKGLARVVAQGIDKVNDAELRQKLARAVVKRSGTDPEFKAYAKKMAQSSHKDVREAVEKQSEGDQ